MTENHDTTGESGIENDPDVTRNPGAVNVSEDRLFELLDRYVTTLHSDDTQSRSAIIQRNPDLGELLACLDSLEHLAPLRPSRRGPENETGSVLDGIVAEPTAADQMSDAPAEFGKYVLFEEVGRGGMGVVYRAKQTDLDRVVALKMILSSRFASEEEIQRFYGEARAAGRLRHPNIVGIHEVGELNGQHYFAMDYVEGESLEESLQTGPLAANEAVECLQTIARAVHHLHENQIVHRDLKPSNILIGESGEPILTDFGLAKLFESNSAQTRTGTIIGTPSYMSPEQAGGEASRVSPRSDVYSLGAILYKMLTGRPPFQRGNPLDTLVEVMEGEPTLPTRLNRSIPRELERICLRCLEKSPEKRYRTAAALADDLERFLNGEPVEARQTGVISRIRRWGRREPALASRLGALFVASLIVQITYVVRENGDFPFHVKVMSLFGLWTVVAVVFQQFLKRRYLAGFTRFAWAAADAILLTTLLFIAEGPIGPLLIGYPVLIAASGLFFRVRLVVFMTCVSLLSYGVLTLLRGDMLEMPPQYPVIYAAVLAVVGFIVGYQVYRIRVLSRHFEHRRLP